MGNKIDRCPVNGEHVFAYVHEWSGEQRCIFCGKLLKEGR